MNENACEKKEQSSITMINANLHETLSSSYDLIESVVRVLDRIKNTPKPECGSCCEAPAPPTDLFDLALDVNQRIYKNLEFIRQSLRQISERI